MFIRFCLSAVSDLQKACFSRGQFIVMQPLAIDWKEHRIHGMELSFESQEPAASVLDGHKALLLVIKEPETLEERVRDTDKPEPAVFFVYKSVDGIIVSDAVRDTGEARAAVSIEGQKGQTVFTILT